MIKKSGIDFANLPDEDFDEMLGESTGAAVIFGVTGGVMEAALRTAYEVITGQKLEKLEFTDVRGLEGREGSQLQPQRPRPQGGRGAFHGRGFAPPDAVRSGEKSYTFIEVMGCPGGLRETAAASQSSPPRSARSTTRAYCAPRRSTPEGRGQERAQVA